jgi:hypothetical protein
MSTYQQKPDRTNVFKNSYKSSDSHPDYKGKLVLSTDLLKSLVAEAKQGNEVAIDVAMWVNKQHDGTPYFSMKVEKAWKKEEDSSSDDGAWENPPPASKPASMDDEIPF